MAPQVSLATGPIPGRIYLAGRSASLSSQIVAEMRDALFAKRLKPGDFLGGEKDIAARFGVSRIVARDALRSLEALGVVEIRMGKGGGARIARGNARLFAEALAVQLKLAGVSAGEILDAQRAIEVSGGRARRPERDRRRSRPAQAASGGGGKQYRSTSKPIRARAAIFTSRSPRPRTIACSSCS